MDLIAGTILVEDSERQIKFLVNQTNKLFVTSYLLDDKTALATILEKLRSLVNFDIDHLELVELTNSVYKGKDIPLYVFSYNGEDDLRLKNIADETDIYGWLNYKDLKKTFEQVTIQGVPNFKH
ncbi:MAG TPA: hypothetical protein VK107_00430 [Alloiococcus sp.]|nr:hypothetical protein [Alloiococcus sp.]